MTNHPPDVISRPPEITSLEQVPEALKEVADYINAIPSTVDSLLLNPAPEAASTLQAVVVKQLFEHALASLNEAKKGKYSPPDLEQPQKDSEPHKSPEFLRALGAIASVAGFVQSAHELDFTNTVDPDSHREAEVQSRYHEVMEILKTNTPSLSLESGLDSLEYASPEWFTKFIEDHPEQNDPHPHDIDRQILKVYALAGSDKDNYNEVFAAIDGIKWLGHDEKPRRKADFVVNKAPGLSIDDGYAAIDGIKRLGHDYKAWHKAKFVLNKLSMIGNKEKMAKALELGFSNK
ncbi:hypothetical protein KC952_03560 [Candidatus Saccharibacteria bacterium]|nr:hypothetical protein [Candidatus Saccharibacteria bacterium]